MRDQKDLPSKCEIMGHEIDPSKITNPHLRRAIMQEAGFLFGYSESSQESEKGSKHTDRVGHDDEVVGHGMNPNRHVDRKYHTDEWIKYDNSEPWGA
jgi:hypothetical protein